MRDLTLAMRSAEINSPDAVSTLVATKLFIDCFLFISWTTKGTDYRAIVSGRCHFLVVAILLDGWPASSTTGKWGFRNYYAVDATKEIPIGIVYDTHLHIHTHIYLYIYVLTPRLARGQHAPARVCTYRSSFKPRCKPRRLRVIS